jgi:viologen exporter family transport system ATP-binding protein
MHVFRLATYGYLLRAQIQSQAQYRTSFVVDLLGSVAFGVLDLVTVVVLSVQADGRRITYALDGDAATAGNLVRRLAGVAALRDISVLEPAIEDVVARLYAGRSPESSR